MKFLCVPCDEPMQLKEKRIPEEGSLSVIFACPECSHSVAMLTNPQETQMVASLGVRIGPPAADGAAEGEGGCPFTGAVREELAARPAFPWTPGAEARLANIPDFVRPMARSGIERYARDKGLHQVDEAILDEAKEHFGM